MITDINRDDWITGIIRNDRYKAGKIYCKGNTSENMVWSILGKDEGTVSFMNYIQVLCCLLDVVLKVSSYTMAREIFQRYNLRILKMHELAETINMYISTRK